MCPVPAFQHELKFLSTPSARRATRLYQEAVGGCRYFYPRPPRGGRRNSACQQGSRNIFLSTPSTRRATLTRPRWALPRTHFYPRPPRGGRRRRREPARGGRHFYPRPPRGGRPVALDSGAVPMTFLSTPSTRRATTRQPIVMRFHGYFYPRPPRGGRPGHRQMCEQLFEISIHALREEGDRPGRNHH